MRTPPNMNAQSSVGESAESLIAYCRENNRACPMPQRWNTLWELLQNPGGEHGLPPMPLILAVWHDTPAMLKMMRLTEQIEWAVTHGTLERVSAFLRQLPEADWFHVGE